MTLNNTQLVNTRKELKENFDLAGLTEEQVTSDLHISHEKFVNVMNLTQQSLDDPWIMRNYLIDQVKAAGKQPVAFSALAGDWHRHWFLNSNRIDSKEMTAGDY